MRVAVGNGVKLAVTVGGTKAVGEIVGVSVMVLVTVAVTVIGVAVEGGVAVAVTVGVTASGAPRMVRSPAQ